jgi:tetratricopeptide (TPR) repeat protein
VKKVWNPLYIGIISYFCLVAPAVILWGLNFRKLGRPDLTRPIWIVGTVLFLLLVLGWIYLPASWDWGLEVFHLGICIGMAAFQYPHYRRFIEADEDQHGVESLFKPALLSVLFILTLASAYVAWGWYLQRQSEEQILLARDQYDRGNYPEAVATLKQVLAEDSGQRLAYINLSIAYETMGKPDSAVIAIEDWLKLMPEDSDAKERLYQLRYQKAGN